MGFHIALLRGVNVGGNQLVAMAELRRMFDRLGLGEARSLLQSGNIVFESEGRTTAQLETLLEAEAMKRFKLPAPFFVRTAENGRPPWPPIRFPKAAQDDPSHFVILFLKKAPKPDAVRALQAAIVGRELVAASGRQAYIVYSDGIGRSLLTPNIVDAKLGQRGTGRNWNTVLKLAALAGVCGGIGAASCRRQPAAASAPDARRASGPARWPGRRWPRPPAAAPGPRASAPSRSGETASRSKAIHSLPRRRP